jgi:hypothetical protein
VANPSCASVATAATAGITAQKTDDTDTVEELLDLQDRLGLSEAALAGLIGISNHTLREIRLGRRLPHSKRGRVRVQDFVDRNRGASSRTDLRLSDEPGAST